MTSGSPVKHILSFTWPLLIGNIFQQLYNMVDSVVVGNYVGSDALAAVGTCGSIHFLMFSLCAGLASGIGVIVAQCFGAKDHAKVKSAIASSFLIMSTVSLAVTTLGLLISAPVLHLLKVPASIFNDALTYLRVTLSGIIAISFYNGVSSILRALGDSRTPLYFLIVASITNVILDLVFVLVFKWGVFGVGLATILSQIVSAAASLLYAFKKVEYFHFAKGELKPDIHIVKKTFVIGIPLAMQGALIALSCMVLQGVVNSFGETVISAYTIEGRIEQLSHQPFGSLAAAVTTYSGQNMGAHKLDRVKKGYRQALLVVLIFSIMMIPLNFLLGRFIVRLFVKDEAVIAVGVKAIRFTCLFYFPLGMIYLVRGVLNGCGDAGFAMMNGIVEVSSRIGYSPLFTSIPGLGYMAVWWVNGITWTTTAVLCTIRYYRGKWMQRAALSS